MKILTKYFRVVLCFMAFALCSFMFAFTPTLTAVQAAEMAIAGYNVAINAVKMPMDTVDATKDEFKIPLLGSVLGTTGTNYSISVTDPTGSRYEYDVATGTSNVTSFFGIIKEESGKKFLTVNAKNDGVYSVVYIVKDGGKTYYSNSYKVTVTNVTYELDFSTPVWNAQTSKVEGFTKTLFKSKVPVNAEFVIPTVYAKQKNKKLDVDATGKVTNNVAAVKVTKGTTLLTDADFTTNAKGEKCITPTETGVYTIEYSYADSVNRPTKTFTVEVVSEADYNASIEKLKLASTPTMPTIELGKTITLPKLTVNAGAEKNVETNVTSIVIEKENNSAIRCELKNNTFEFKMAPENFEGTDKYDDLVGNYRITYTVAGTYETQTLTETFKVDGVTVSAKPTISLAYSFDTKNDDQSEKTVEEIKAGVKLGAEIELKTEYTDAGFIVPAVYVEDAVTTKYSDFTIIRTLRKGSTYYYIDNLQYDQDANNGEGGFITPDAKYQNASEDANIGDPSKAVKFEFSDEATNVATADGLTYYLEYRVISKQVKDRESYLKVAGTDDQYSFKIVTDANARAKSTPTIEITNLTNLSVKNTDKVSVKVKSTDDNDTRLKNAVFTYTSKKTGATQTLNYYIEEAIAVITGSTDAEKEEYYKNATCNILDDDRFITEMSKYYEGFAPVTENEDTRNSFDLNLEGKTDSVEVVAIVLNDDGKANSATKTLNIKNTTTDDQAPTLSIYEVADIWKDKTDNTKITEFTIGQGKEVKLPTIYVADEDLSLNVMYYINSPVNSYGSIDYKSPNGKNFYYGKVSTTDVQFIEGGTITTSETGVYYVVYTATDVAGNTSVMYFTFNVEDTSKPVLKVEPVGEDITRTGNQLEAEKGATIDFETTLRSANGANDYTNAGRIKIIVDDGGKELDFEMVGKTAYRFNDYGTYTVKITDTIAENAADAEIFKVVIAKQEIKWLGEFDLPTSVAKGEIVKLPVVAASNEAVVKAYYVLPNGSLENKKEAEEVNEGGYKYYKFTATEEGRYTIVYVATTSDDTLEKSNLYIQVGDNIKPTISINDNSLRKDIVYDGTNKIEYKVEINRNKKTFVVTINDGTNTFSYNNDELGIKVSDYNDTGLVSSNMSWNTANVQVDFSGDNFTKGTITETSYQYFINGAGEYSLIIKATDNAGLTTTKTINFNVVSKAEVKENKDTVIGAVLIVISLVLLAGVILFFAFTGTNGFKGLKKNKTHTTKAVKTKEKVEKIEETKAEEVAEEKVEEVAEAQEETQEVESEEVQETESTEDEAKSGEVE